MLGIPTEAEIDVMNDDNAGHYYEHSDQFHVAIDLTGGRRGLQARLVTPNGRVPSLHVVNPVTPRLA